jgi:hypothetical protein
MLQSGAWMEHKSIESETSDTQSTEQSILCMGSCRAILLVACGPALQRHYPCSKGR